jgi:hypothetical protein
MKRNVHNLIFGATYFPGMLAAAFVYMGWASALLDDDHGIAGLAVFLIGLIGSHVALLYIGNWIADWIEGRMGR